MNKRDIRILFIADGRSPTAINWMDHFVNQGYEIHLASTHRFSPSLNYKSSMFIGKPFRIISNTETENTQEQPENQAISETLIKRIPVKFRTYVRNWIIPFTLKKRADYLKEYVDLVKPDLIHALRIPFEGILSGMIDHPSPLLVSVWGNDFTLHARSNPIMMRLTQSLLSRIDGLITDCERDLRLGHRLGYAENNPSLVIPGGGGIKFEDFFLPDDLDGEERLWTIINPRGIRAYVRNDTFFKAIPLVLEEIPELVFVCPGMKGSSEAEGWVSKLGIRSNVRLLGGQSRGEMGDLFRNAIISVSPSTHDGTPNSLLESMACGCFPISGNLESIREWITAGENGELFDSHDPLDLSRKILSTLKNKELMERARDLNQRIIRQRAYYPDVMKKADEFYESFIRNDKLEM